MRVNSVCVFAFCLFDLQRHTVSTPKALSSLVDKRSSYSELSMPGVYRNCTALTYLQ